MGRLSPERWQVISPFLDRALDLSAGERTTWLGSLRASDPALATDLEALLEKYDALNRQGFLDDGAPPLPTPASLAGQAVGAWTLVSSIGHGGMGTVWLARRSDGRFEGLAAVKLMNASLIGQAGEERFRREGNILARLRHPNIAQLIDAGVSRAGQPYLVLEHVEGEHIDRYCDDRRLGIDARVRIFLDVLAAVAFAHAHLIVHRDLKPSNVLVRTDGQVKLLDFGIAKLLEGETASGEATALTREGGRALTPEYAAPEQVTGGQVTVATDVYAMGVLLYVVLGGRHPAGASTSSPAELLKAIVDTEPERLSAAVVRPYADSPEELGENAARRSSTTERLRRSLKGDLETIVGKALKKNPAERYASATALADDLRRYLEHQPIGARADTLGYRAARFVRRHRTPVAFAALAMVALAAGLVGTVTQARRARAQAARADQQARAAGQQRDFALRQLSRAEAINDLNAFLLSDAAPSGESFTVGDLLTRAEQVIERERGESDENRVEILIAIGRQYWSQDEDDKARRVLGRAYELSGSLQEHSLRAKAACTLASALARAGEVERAERLVREGLDALPNEPQFALDRVSCLLRGSEVAREGSKVDVGIERARAAQRLLKELPLVSALTELTVSMDLADCYRMAGRNREAAAAFRDAFQRLSSLGRDETQKAGTLLNNWGLVIGLHQPLEAERLYRQAIRISSADRTERSVSPMLLNNLARTLSDLNRLPEAAAYADRAHARAREAGDEVVVTQSLTVRATICRLRGDLRGAEKLLAEMEQRVRKMLPPGHVVFAALGSERALLAQARGDLPAAKAGADEAVALAERGTQREFYLPRVLLRRAELELQMQLWGEASADAAAALSMWQQTMEPGTLSSVVGRCRLAIGRALQAQGKLEEARASFASALQNLEPTVGADHPLTRDARVAASGATLR